jgi:hypothetical protein
MGVVVAEMPGTALTDVEGFAVELETAFGATVTVGLTDAFAVGLGAAATAFVFAGRG